MLKMKSLFEKFFSRKAEHDYVVSEYKGNPAKFRRSTPKNAGFEFELDELDTLDFIDEKDEMEIDNLYQKN